MDLRKALETFDAAYNEAFDRGDAAGCAAFFTEDVLLMSPNEPMVRGREAFEEAYRTRMAESRGGTHSNSLIEFGGGGELAYQVGTFTVSGAAQTEQGKFLNVLKRQVDGTWKVAITMFNSDKPE